MRIERLGSSTSSHLTVIDVDSPLQDAAASPANPGIGLLVVSGGDKNAAGVLSKSDLIRHIILGDAKDVTAGSLMSTQIICCAPEDDFRPPGDDGSPPPPEYAGALRSS